MSQDARFTTEYVDLEDRIRLVSDDGSGKTDTVWLTHRLLQRLLPMLLQFLERQGAGEGEVAGLMQEFAQSAARSGVHAGGAPVKPEGPDSGWLAKAVDIGEFERGVSLRFRSVDNAWSEMVLPAAALRQWLNILIDLYRRADWPMEEWPEWMRQSQPAQGGATAVLH